MLLLANSELLDVYVAKARIKRPKFDAAMYAEDRQYDMNDYHMVGNTACIEICGPLCYKMDEWAWWMDCTSYIGLQNKIKDAQADPNVKEILFIVDTPGGEVTGLKECAKIIADCTKPTKAFVDPCCASAGLWLASQCDKIYSIPSGEIGSLGVQCVAANFSKYFAENGIEYKVFRAEISPDKNLGIPYEPMSDEATSYFQSRVDKLGNEFVTAVANGRRCTTDKVLSDFGKGKMLFADEAISVGLIDGIASIEELCMQENKTFRISARVENLKSR